MKPRILVVGNTYIDFVCRAETMPERGQVLVSELGYAFVTSGGGAFEAVGASRQGADVVLCTKLGNDAYASQLKKKFAAENVDTRFVGVHKPSQTGLCVTVCENTGRDRVIIYPGANAALTPGEIDDAFSCYPDALLISCDVKTANVLAAAEFAKRDGVKLFLDLRGADNAFPLEKIAKAHTLILDEKSVYSLCGMYTNDVNGCLGACISLSSKLDVKFCVINLENRGSFVYDGTYSRIIDPVEVQIVDRSASHEAFCSSLCADFLQNGGDIYKACSHANSSFAFSASKLGGLSSLPK